MADTQKPFDPLGQISELQSMWASWLGPFVPSLNPFNPIKLGLPGIGRVEGIDPAVQEIAIIAAMHNLSSLLRDPGKIKAVLSEELAERAKKLAGS
jgi:hypothetical protein